MEANDPLILIITLSKLLYQTGLFYRNVNYVMPSRHHRPSAYPGDTEVASPLDIPLLLLYSDYVRGVI